MSENSTFCAGSLCHGNSGMNPRGPLRFKITAFTRSTRNGSERILNRGKALPSVPTVGNHQNSLSLSFHICEMGAYIWLARREKCNGVNTFLNARAAACRKNSKIIALTK